MMCSWGVSGVGVQLVLVTLLGAGYCQLQVHEVDESDLWTPCHKLEHACLLGHFTSRGWCGVRPQNVSSDAADLVFIPEIRFSVPTYNQTVVHTNVEIQGISSGRVIKFYENNKSGSSVLVVQFEQLVVSGVALISVLRPRREIKYWTGYTTEIYDNVETTSVINKYGEWESFAVLNVPPRYSFGEDSCHVKGQQIDDDVKEFLNQLKLSVSIGAFEAFNKRPPYIVAGVVRNIICSYKDNK